MLDDLSSFEIVFLTLMLSMRDDRYAARLVEAPLSLEASVWSCYLGSSITPDTQSDTILLRDLHEQLTFRRQLTEWLHSIEYTDRCPWVGWVI